MLRAVLLGMLCVTTVSACKSKAETSAKAEPGVAAGKVIEVKGAVTVKHGDATTPLTVGASVEGDDTVITGADGNVVIELAHNSARWELGPNKQQKVRESIAWKAAKSTGEAKHVEQDTAAAGRPAERAAAGTTATGDVEPAAEMAPAAAAPAPPPPPAAAAEKSDAEDAPAPRPTRRRATAAAAPREEAAPAAEAAPAPMDEAPARSTTRGAKKRESAPAPAGLAGIGVGGGGVGAGGGGTGAGMGAGATATASAATGPAPDTLIQAKQGALKACVANHPHAVKLLVSVKGGQPKTIAMTSETTVTPAIDACVRKVLAGITFGADGKATLTLTP